MRDLHLVIATIGRSSCPSVAREAIAREGRLARLTIVAQGARVVDDDLARLAAQRAVVLDEIVLARPVGAGRARYMGALLGNEDFVGFLDDDISFEAGSLSVLADACERVGLGGACGVVTVPRTSLVAVAVRTVCFRSIFRDPRPWATRRGRLVATNLLSGGMAVYRRALYDRCASSWRDFGPGTRGEDMELSYAVSRLAPLAVDPAVRVRNLSAQSSIHPEDATTRALRNLACYRGFGTRHARAPLQWLAYVVVLLAVAVRWLAVGAGAAFGRAVLSDVVTGAARALTAGVGPLLGARGRRARPIARKGDAPGPAWMAARRWARPPVHSPVERTVTNPDWSRDDERDGCREAIDGVR